MGIYLKAPKTEKENETGKNTSLEFVAAGMQGWRVNMEDAHIAHLDIAPGISLFAVFDGHGGKATRIEQNSKQGVEGTGSEVSKYCKKKFGDELKKNKNFATGNYKTALEETCLKIDQLLDTPDGRSEVLRLREGGPGMMGGEITAGCTANIVLITKDRIICANAGDSRSVLHSGGQTTALSKDHKPDDPIEYDRILKVGGYVADGRVNGNLNLSRALGDLEYKRTKGKPPKEQLISPFPDVSDRKRDPKDEFIVMGCDGIWETETNDQICQFVKQKMSTGASLTTTVNSLLDSLLAKETSMGVGCDNMTSIIIKFLK